MPLIEDEVIRAVAALLRSDGWEVSHVQGKAKGLDIRADRALTGQRLAIEAKGGAHSGADPSNAAFRSVAEAFMTSVAWRGQEEFGNWQIGIALPRSKWFDRHLARIDHGLIKFSISVFQVSDNGDVEVIWRT